MHTAYYTVCRGGSTCYGQPGLKAADSMQGSSGCVSTPVDFDAMTTNCHMHLNIDTLRRAEGHTRVLPVGGSAGGEGQALCF